jgi:hypothetical protein
MTADIGAAGVSTTADAGVAGSSMITDMAGVNAAGGDAVRRAASTAEKVSTTLTTAVADSTAEETFMVEVRSTEAAEAGSTVAAAVGSTAEAVTVADAGKFPR